VATFSGATGGVILVFNHGWTQINTDKKRSAKFLTRISRINTNFLAQTYARCRRPSPQGLLCTSRRLFLLHPCLSVSIHGKNMDSKLRSEMVAVRKDLPGQGTAGLIFGHAGFEKVFLLAQVNGFTHPRERIFRAIFHGQTNPFKATVGNMLDIFPEQTGI
jgi:hypothetical protein